MYDRPSYRKVVIQPRWPVTMLSVYLTEREFNDLPEYSTTNPTGCYPGKMWKSHPVDTTRRDANGFFPLKKHFIIRAYTICDNPNACSITPYRPVISAKPLNFHPNNEHLRAAIGFNFLTVDNMYYWDAHTKKDVKA